jgi:hypothetical protein
VKTPAEIDIAVLAQLAWQAERNREAGDVRREVISRVLDEQSHLTSESYISDSKRAAPHVHCEPCTYTCGA